MTTWQEQRSKALNVAMIRSAFVVASAKPEEQPAACAALRAAIEKAKSRPS